MAASTPQSPAEAPTAEGERQSEPEFNSFLIPVLGDAHIATDDALGVPFTRNGPMPGRIVASTVECHIVSIDAQTGDTTLLWNYIGADSRYFHCNPDKQENSPPNYESTASFILDLEWINPSYILMSLCCEPAAGRFELIDISNEMQPIWFRIVGDSFSMNEDGILAYSQPNYIFGDQKKPFIRTSPFAIRLYDGKMDHSYFDVDVETTLYSLALAQEYLSSAEASVRSLTWVGSHRIAFMLWTKDIYPKQFPLIGIIDIASQSIIFRSRGVGWSLPTGDADGNLVAAEQDCIRFVMETCYRPESTIVVLDPDTLTINYGAFFEDYIIDMDLSRGWLLVTFRSGQMGTVELADGTFTPIADGIVNASWAE